MHHLLTCCRWIFCQQTITAFHQVNGRTLLASGAEEAKVDAALISCLSPFLKSADIWQKICYKFYLNSLDYKASGQRESTKAMAHLEHAAVDHERKPSHL